eukprot:4072921-Prymnesium_polylepis.1
MQGGREVQAGPSGTVTPACGARGGRPLFPPFARLYTPHEKKAAAVHVASCCESRSNGPGIVNATLY